MLVQDYISAGYPVSSLIAQSVIDRAEKDVTAAYIVPIVGSVPSQTELSTDPLKSALMGLSALLVQQRTISATRAGAKAKMTDQSTSPTREDVLRQSAATCAHYLRQIDTSVHVEDVVSDICGIFFRTNFFYHN